MEQNLNTELRLENAIRDDHFLRIRPDSGNTVCVNVVFEDEMINLCNRTEQDDSGDDNYFNLDKFQTGCLIDYLKRMYDLME